MEWRRASLGTLAAPLLSQPVRQNWDSRGTFHQLTARRSKAETQCTLHHTAEKRTNLRIISHKGGRNVRCDKKLGARGIQAHSTPCTPHGQKDRVLIFFLLLRCTDVRSQAFIFCSKRRSRCFATKQSPLCPASSLYIYSKPPTPFCSCVPLIRITLFYFM